VVCANLSAVTSDVVARAGTLLLELRLRGKVAADEGSADQSGLVAGGLARRAGDALVLTPAGRARSEIDARLAPGSGEEAAAQRAYDGFLPLNAEVLRVTTDWQVRPGGVPNDHTDAKYDWAVIDRLVAVDQRVGPVVRRLGDTVARFGGYRARLRDAVRRVQDGEHDWLSSPRCDSYHTVWMRLHEDLLLALGIDRNEEGPPA